MRRHPARPPPRRRPTVGAASYCVGRDRSCRSRCWSARERRRGAAAATTLDRMEPAHAVVHWAPISRGVELGVYTPALVRPRTSQKACQQVRLGSGPGLVLVACIGQVNTSRMQANSFKDSPPPHPSSLPVAFSNTLPIIWRARRCMMHARTGQALTTHASASAAKRRCCRVCLCACPRCSRGSNRTAAAAARATCQPSSTL